MPLFDIVEGIKINVYANDHVPPHIHALYGEHEALIAINAGNVIAGYLPRKPLTKAQDVVQTNKADLLALFYSLNPQIKKR